MPRHFRPALLVLVAGCVDLTPPTPIISDGPIDPGVVDARPEDAMSGPDDARKTDGTGLDGRPEDVRQDDARLDGAAPVPDGPVAPPDGPQPDTRPPDGALLANGAACSSGTACTSGVCFEGVCCNQSCGQLCYSCKVAGAVGTCTAAGVGVDPRLECSAQATSTCGRAGGCNGAGGCRLHPSGTTCVAARCLGSTETTADTCNGQGTCVPGTTRSCAPYICAGTTCGTTCTSNSQCSPGNACFIGGCVPTASVPVLYWSFDEASGTTALDGSGNGLDGTYTGASGSPQPSTDVPALTFSNPRSRAFSLSSRQGVRLLSMPASLRPANNLTISLWYLATRVDPDNGGDEASDLLSGGDNYMIHLYPTGLHFVKRTSSFERCFATLANGLDGQWHHVAAVASSSGMKVYFDGVERCSNGLNDAISYSAGTELWVGRHGDGNTDRDFDGRIDDVRVYNRALSATEVGDLADGKR
jgi:hypothetical protein